MAGLASRLASGRGGLKHGRLARCSSSSGPWLTSCSMRRVQREHTAYTPVMSHPPASPSVHPIHASTHTYMSSRMGCARLCLSEPQPCLESMPVSTVVPSGGIIVEVLSQAIAAYPRPAHGAFVTSSAVPLARSRSAAHLLSASNFARISAAVLLCLCCCRRRCCSYHCCHY